MIFLCFFRHVIMGFPWRGDFLISYKLKIEDSGGIGDTVHTYSLHWWRFSLYKPLKQVIGVCNEQCVDKSYDVMLHHMMSCYRSGVLRSLKAIPSQNPYRCSYANLSVRHWLPFLDTGLFIHELMY